MVDPTSPSYQLVGAVLNGRFKLVRLLGEGGMGAVFEADGIRGEGKRAIKLLHEELAHEPQVLNRFLTEAVAVQSLKHPHVATIYEANRAENGTPYLVMELLVGLPLTAFISKREPMTVALGSQVVHEVLQALKLAHSKGVVHRDLKPDNIFLVRTEQGGYFTKVLDFGIAKVMDVAGGMGTKTRTGALLGTPGYMSPEQIKNSKGVDPRSDLWSVGAMFYEMLTGTEPFVADNDFARLTATITSEPRPIEQVAPHLAAWGQFFRRALAKDPAARFQNAEEMDHSLMTLAGGAPSVPAWSTAPTPRAAQGSPAQPQGPHSEAPVGLAHPPVGTEAVTTAIKRDPNPAPSPPQKASPTGVGGTVAMNIVSEPSHAPEAPPPGQATVPLPTQPIVQKVQNLSGVPAGHVPIAFMATAQAPAPMMAPIAGAAGVSNTQPSAMRPGSPPSYTPAHAPPPVEVVQAPPYQPGAPWWVVGVVAFVCLGLGFAAGLLVAG